MRPNSITRRVIEAVRAKGSATVDEILPLIPGVGREQAKTALRNARLIGELHVVRRGGGREQQGGSKPSIYTIGPGTRWHPPPVVEVIEAEEPDDEQPLSHEGLPPRGRIPNVASVWELGTICG